MFDWIRRTLGRPRAETWIVIVSTVLVLPSVVAGLAADDYIHQIALGSGNPIEGFRRTPIDLFRFATPDVTPSLIDDGVLPWWSDPDVQFAFFRPLAAASHYFDHLVFPQSAVLMHLHTLAWAVLAVLAARAVYRLVHGPGLLATVALFLYAMDDARAAPVAWVANRNELIACAISVYALALHIRHKTTGDRRLLGLAPALLGVALLASEGAIAVTGYLFAHAVFLEKGPLPRRLLGLAPYAGVVVVWAVIYRALGYGIHGSGVYFDPVGSPLDYVLWLPERFAMLWLSQLGGPWSEGWNAYEVMLPGFEKVVVVLAIVTLGGVAWLFRPLALRDPKMRFWLAGALIGTLPACGAFPADRLLPWIGIGAMGATACFFTAFLEATPRPGFGAERVGAVLVVLAHFIEAPLFLPMRSGGIAEVRASIDRADRNIPRDPSVARKLVVYMNPAADPFASYIPVTRAARGVPRARQRWLAAATTDVQVERVDERTLRVRQQGGLMQLPSERLFRNVRTHPFRVGDRVVTPDLTLTLTEVLPDGRPLELLARFDRPLEDPGYLFFKWRGDGYAPFTPPPIGGRETLPKSDLIEVVYGSDSPVTKWMQSR